MQIGRELGESYAFKLGGTVAANTPETSPQGLKIGVPFDGRVGEIWVAWPDVGDALGVHIGTLAGEGWLPRSPVVGPGGYVYADGVDQSFPVNVDVSEGEIIRSAIVNPNASEQLLSVVATIAKWEGGR